MPSIDSLVSSIARSHPSLTLQSGDDFSWNPDTNTLTYGDMSTTHSTSLLLHELAHALLKHNSYTRDIELIKIEREAWDHARQILAHEYGVTIPESVAEDSLDTYRDWIHKRSLCPSCGINGVQESRTVYRCIHCHQRWTVNEARTCRLKRTRINKNTPSN